MSSEFLKFSCVNTDISQYLQKQRICGRFPEKLLRIDRFIQSGLHKRFRTTSPLTEQSSSFVWISSILSCVCTHLENQSFARFCRTSKMIRDTTHFEWASRKHAARQCFVDKYWPFVRDSGSHYTSLKQYYVNAAAITSSRWERFRKCKVNHKM